MRFCTKALFLPFATVNAQKGTSGIRYVRLGGPSATSIFPFHPISCFDEGHEKILKSSLLKAPATETRLTEFSLISVATSSFSFPHSVAFRTSSGSSILPGDELKSWASAQDLTWESENPRGIDAPQGSRVNRRWMQRRKVKSISDSLSDLRKTKL